VETKFPLTFSKALVVELRGWERFFNNPTPKERHQNAVLLIEQHVLDLHAWKEKH